MFVGPDVCRPEVDVWYPSVAAGADIWRGSILVGERHFPSCLVTRYPSEVGSCSLVAGCCVGSVLCVDPVWFA